MTNEVVSALLKMYVEEVEYESAITRKVLAAVPAGQGSYRPSEKCMTALDLGFHIASAEIWFLKGIAAGDLAPGDSTRPEAIATPADVVAYYDAHIGPAIAAVKTLDTEAAGKILDFYGMFQLPAVAYLSFMNRHSIHHRGQLSAYLRPMGAKVPAIYGGSADEPMTGAASA